MTTWKAAASSGISLQQDDGGDDWETDPDFVNDVSEEEQRWGSKTVEGSGRTAGSINIHQLRAEVTKDDAQVKKELMETGPKASFGYGGKFGVQKDRMDKSALGHDYIAKVEKHASQIDSTKGFGGKFGLQSDRQDKSAVGWDYHQKMEKHASQKDYVSGFGGKYGVQKDRVDKSAVGWDYHVQMEKHESQKDYAKGFGGKFGVETEKQDKSAVGWEYHEKTQKHSSQIDYSQGFGGKYGIQLDRIDKSAHGWEEVTKTEAHPSQTDMKRGFGGKYGVETDRQDKSAHAFTEVEKPKATYEKPQFEGGNEKASSLRAKFESMAQSKEDDTRKRAEEERAKRLAQEQKERSESQKAEERRQSIPNEVQSYNEPEMIKQSHPVTSDEITSPTVLHSPITSPVVMGFGGKYGVQKDRVDKSAVGWDYHVKMENTVTVTSPLHEEETITASNVQEEPQLLLHNNQIKSPEVLVENENNYEAQPTSQALQPPGEDMYEQIEAPPEGTGLSAIALYDYQAGDSDEITFDPDDIITNIDMIDEGWWRGECRGQVGLFPANYVQLIQQ